MKAIQIGLLAISLIPAVALAEYVGPAASTATTVKSILDNPVNDQTVVLRGHLLRRLSSDKYQFSDGSGEIRVDIDAKYIPADKISDKTVVELHGKVDKEWRETTEIDVHEVKVVR
ncbi:uncharacterized protein (TIGR00156 family) [Chitinivorax tropicus]|uniref:Uncharacterized protein (TIGR00156 family) n=1 Tax=Chitinivorax tropicus TaxID=714531 RepID=A0A840MMN0_9PROT|nr:NirD/YgiW/YdeI family stress tolerance protein [Chitinivorax tropicus]MBB5020404.1 uncharacterized protein (TIGR00156 family) [Chitinivorax tropicus]